MFTLYNTYYIYALSNVCWLWPRAAIGGTGAELRSCPCALSVGCLQDRDPHDEDIASAAKHAIELKKAAAGSDAALANMTYIRVLKAASQVRRVQRNVMLWQIRLLMRGLCMGRTGGVGHQVRASGGGAEAERGGG
jgi:hypothetical protein